MFSRFGAAGLLDPGDIDRVEEAAAACGLCGAEIRAPRRRPEGATEGPQRRAADFVFEVSVPPRLSRNR